MSQPTVAVIIAAFNAAATIRRAVESALIQPEVTEVIVVDDHSHDETAAVAAAVGEGDCRVKILRQPSNLGPSAARNRAIEASTSEVIAILDADDVFLSGRIAPLVAADDWDLCADNILFVDSEAQIPTQAATEQIRQDLDRIEIDPANFIRGNISKRGHARGELGFLKPLIKRRTLKEFRVRYYEDCRLGEDFLLYSELLLKGARFSVFQRCGYAALVRSDSLSAQHDVDALESLYARCTALRSSHLLADPVYRALTDHMSSVRRKINHRRALATKKQFGLVQGLAYVAARPMTGLDILRDLIADPPGQIATPKALLSSSDFQKLARSGEA